VIRPDVNLGFGKGNNIGIRRAIDLGADCVFLLNQDAYIIKGCIEALIASLESNPKAALVSPIHLAGDERNLDFLFYKYAHPMMTPNFIGDMMRGKSLHEYVTEFVNAAAWLVRTSTIKEVGMFHPAFDHYGEDREYIARLQRRGYVALICAQSWIVHDRPQDRSSNRFHDHSSSVARGLLQGLVEGRSTYSDVNLRMLELLLKNIMMLRYRESVNTVRNWSWLLGKRRLLGVALRFEDY
jgi:GT2 family glycosyltransferase